MKPVRLSVCLALGVSLAPDMVVAVPPPRLVAPGGQVATDGAEDDRWTRIERETMDVRALTPMGQVILDMDDVKWEHAQTEHFVIHFERSSFAKKVADMGEFFYRYVSEDLGAPRDIVEGRSHIFVFRTPERWQEFMHYVPAGMEWAFSMVQGPVMYLQEADDTSSSADVLAHEMTHLILNRFFMKQIPAWLNEGIAEWYGELAYSAFKGIHRRSSSQFRELEHPFPVEELLEAETYPSEETAVTAFYDTSKHVVAYLRLAFPAEKFPQFMMSMMEGKDVILALQTHFDIYDYEALQTGFEKFLK